MTPKEKAKQIIEQYQLDIFNSVPSLQSDYFILCIRQTAKKCATIAANEIIHQYKTLNVGLADGRYIHEKVNYWLQVLNEIENL